MSQLKIDYEKVNAVVNELKSQISTSQGEWEDMYGKATESIEDYSGEEVEALRVLLEKEKRFTFEVCEFLQKFVESIQFITDELQNLDVTGATHISTGAATTITKGGTR